MKKFGSGFLAGVALIAGCFAVVAITDHYYGWTDRIFKKDESSETVSTSEIDSIPGTDSETSSEAKLTAEDYMSEVRAQVSEETDGKRSVRFVVAVKGSYDSETGESKVPGDYGFTILINGTEKDQKATNYYNSITAGGVTYANPYSDAENAKTIDEFAGRSGYTFFIAVTVANIPEASYGTEIAVTPYVEIDGEKITGATRTTSVNDLIQSVVL